MEYILIFINVIVLIGLFVFVLADRHKMRKVLSNTIKSFDDLERSYGTVYSDGQLTRTLVTEVYRYLKTWKGETMPKERFTELGDARPAGTDGAYDVAPVNEEQNKGQQGEEVKEDEDEDETVLETNAEPPSPAVVMNSRVQEKIQETQKEKRNKPAPKKTPSKAKSDAKTPPSKRKRAPAKKKAAKKAAPKK